MDIWYKLKKISGGNVIMVKQRKKKVKKEKLFSGRKLYEVPGYFCLSCKNKCEKYDDICKGYRRSIFK